MVLPSTRLLRQACTATILLVLLVTLILHLAINSRRDDFIVDESLRPLLSSREDGAHSFPYNQRQLFHIFDTHPTLPGRFRFIDLKAAHRQLKRANATRARCVVSKTAPSFTICVYPPERDKYISSSLLTSGVWEPYITQAFQTALERFPQATVIDVGANLGYYSLLASAMGHRVVALEPQTENLNRFVAGARADRWNDNIILLANALSDGHRNVSLSRSDDNQGGIRALDRCDQLWPSYSPSSTGGQCTVPTLTLDDLLYVVTSKIVIIKLDIEGYECKALAAASQFFSAIRVPYIFMEWRQMTERQMLPETACPPDGIRRLSSFLADRGYVPHEVRSGIKLSPYNAGRWRVGDVYWRSGDQNLLVPSL